MNRMKLAARSLAGVATSAALVVCAPAALVAQSTTAALTAPAIAPQINEAVAALRAVSTLRASFVQTDRNGQRLSGVLTLKRPGKIRFQYAPGVPLLIVSDGKALTMVDYEVRQVQRWPISNSPFGALLYPTREVARFARLNPVRNPDVVSLEVRDPKHPEYGVITMVFTRKASAPGGLELAAWVALDSQNKRTTVQLSNHAYDVAVSENDFRYNDPRRPTRR